MPADLNRLDQQLRDYLKLQVQRAREKPSDAARQATLGLAYAANQLWVEACRCFSNVTFLDPNEPLGHLYLGVATQEAGDYPGALELFRELTRDFPGFAPAYDRLGTALLRDGRADDAEKAFQRLVELAPREWRGYAGVGEVKLRRNEFAEAARYLEKARGIAPSERVVHHLLGLVYRGLGRKADADWELHLGLNAVQTPMPDPWGATASEHVRLLPQQIDLAHEYLEAGRPAEALQVLNEPARYHPDDLVVLEHLGLAYRSLNQLGPARRVAERMLALNERSVSAQIILTDICLDQGLNDEALSHAERAVALGPDLPQAYLAKGDALFALGKNQEGLAARQDALKRDPQNPLIAVDIGDALLNVFHNSSEALKFYKQAVSLNPVLLLGHLRMAEAAIQLHDFDVARHALREARRLDPKGPDLARLDVRLADQQRGDGRR